MKPRRVSVGYQRDEKFTLTVEEYSRFRSVVFTVLDTLLCKPFGHRFGWQFTVCNALSNWEWRGSKDLVRIPISHAEADKLKYYDDQWDWLDNTDTIAVN